ncbi:MAG: hypothetical protein ACJAWV_000072 [Flammeovirgaceae bacterium]|jgi:hypothetical protein
MKKYLLIFCFSAIAQIIIAQNKPVILKHLIIDRYGMNRIKLSEGDRIWFSLKGEPKNRRYKDYIGKLNEKDSTIYLVERKVEIRVSEISNFYFYRGTMIGLAAATVIPAVGFGVSAAIHPLVTDAQYDPKEQAIISASFFGIGLIARMLIRKKYIITDNTRVRIMDLSFEEKEEKN